MSRARDRVSRTILAALRTSIALIALIAGVAASASRDRTHHLHEPTAATPASASGSFADNAPPWHVFNVPGTAAGDSAPDREALVDLFAATAGATWQNKQNWLASALSMCSWYGVRCNNCSDAPGAPPCRVMALFLPNNKLVGALPASIGNLSAMTMLNLNTNALSGTVPASIARLQNLTYLDFGVRLNWSHGDQNA
jgi:hypothetical protein